MTTTTDGVTDKGVGIAMILGALAVLSAIGMFATAPRAVAGTAFAAAMTFGTLLVVAVHAYWD